MTMGCPTKYDETIIPKLLRFTKKRLKDGVLPTQEGFSADIDVDPDTIQEWMSVHRDFSVAIKKMMAIQSDYLQTFGLGGARNPAMSIFLLKVNHGKIETSKLDHTSGGHPIKGITYLPPEGAQDGSNSD